MFDFNLGHSNFNAMNGRYSHLLRTWDTVEHHN